MDKSWMQESNRFGNRYVEGVNEFISIARSHVDGLDRIMHRPPFFCGQWSK